MAETTNRIHPATAVLLMHGVSPTDVARRAGYVPHTVYFQLRGRLRLTRRTFDAIAALASVSVALEVCATLNVSPFGLADGKPRGPYGKANEAPAGAPLDQGAALPTTGGP